jgi:hypothetical protein
MLGAMEGVTTAVVLYLFVCLVFPRLIKHKPQFYSAFAIILLIILLGSWAAMVGGGSSDHSQDAGASASRGPGAIYGFIGLLQIGAIVLLAMSTAGMSPSEMKEDIGKTIEVIRRGEEEKETIIIPHKGSGSPASPEPRPAPPPRRPAPKEPPDMSLPLD